MVISSEFLIVSSYFVTEIGRSCQGNNTRLSSKINIPDLLSVQTCPMVSNGRSIPSSLPPFQDSPNSFDSELAFSLPYCFASIQYKSPKRRVSPSRT